MPNNFDLKERLLSSLAALKSVNYPRFVKNFSFPSLNNKNNTLEFIIDLLKTIIGYDTIKTELINFLTSKLGDLEITLKNSLKSLLKAKFSCSIDAKIPDSFINGLGVGFNVAVSQIDFFKMLRINPNSVAGALLYEPELDDLNRVLYEAIQNGTASWKNLLIIEFLPAAIVGGQMRTQVFKITVNPFWQGKTINDFFNVFFDSITLFTTGTFLNRLLDSFWGSISSFLNTSRETAQDRADLETFIIKIIELPDIIVDDSYFQFTREDIDNINTRVENLVRGYNVLVDCGAVKTELNIDDIINFNDILGTKTTYIEIKNHFDNFFEELVAQGANNLTDQDREFGLFTLFLNLFKNLIKGIVFSILSPKVVLLMITYFKFLSINVNYRNFREFFNAYKQFIIDIIRKVALPYIIDFLTAVIIREIRQLVLVDKAEQLKEKTKYAELIRLSLIGVPQEIRDILNRL